MSFNNRLLRAILLVGIGTALILTTTNTAPLLVPPLPEEVATPIPATTVPELTPSAVAPVEMLEAVAVAPPVVSAPVTGSLYDWYAQAGISSAEYLLMDDIVLQESNGCPTKWQYQRVCPSQFEQVYSDTDSSVGYGLCQATPAIKYAAEGDDWKTNPVTQARWCYKYALAYGSLSEAISFKYCLGSCYSARTKITVYKTTPWF